eukprot:gene12266-biopygen22954
MSMGGIAFGGPKIPCPVAGWYSLLRAKGQASLSRTLHKRRGFCQKRGCTMGWERGVCLGLPSGARVHAPVHRHISPRDEACCCGAGGCCAVRRGSGLPGR